MFKRSSINIITITFFVFIFLLLGVAKVDAKINAPYNWTNTLGVAYIGDTAVDSQNNVYSTGIFGIGGITSFDFDPSAGIDIHTTNAEDVFVTKYNADGTYAWTHTFGGPYAEEVHGITLDSNDNVYVTGFYVAVVDFDDTAGVDSHNWVDGSTFITKYNSAGVYQWTKTFGGTSSYGRGVAVDSADNLFVTGYFSGLNKDFDSGPGTNLFSSHGYEDIFLTKYNSAGVYQWTKTIGGGVRDKAFSIAMDNTTGMYITGSYQSPNMDFDPSAGTDLHTTNGYDDIFISKYDTAGNYLWSRTVGSSVYPDIAYSIATDGANVYATGKWGGFVDFDGTAGTDIRPSQQGGVDMFVTSYDTNGNYRWTNTVGGIANDIGNTIAVDSNSNIFVGGSYVSPSIDFDPSVGTDLHTLQGSAYPDMFLSRYDSSGNYAWTITLGGISVTDSVDTLAIDNTNNVIMGGRYAGSIDFNTTAGVDIHSSAGSYYDEMFVSKLSATYFQISNLNLNLNAENLSSQNIETGTLYGSASTGETVRVLDNDNGLVISDIVTSFTGATDRNWGSVTGNSDLVTGKAVVGNLTTSPGTASTHSLYIPKLTGTNGVRICPNATTLLTITSNCTGGYLLGETNPLVTAVTINGQAYYKVAGLTGTGGQGVGGVQNALPLRIVLRTSENAGALTNTEVWIGTPVDITANTLVYITYDALHTGGAALTTADITVTCDPDGLDPLTGINMGAVTIVNSTAGYLVLNTNTNTCADWMVVNINGGGGHKLTNPIAGGNYSWAATYDIGGNGTINVDGATLAYVVNANDITITATVAPIIDMELYAAGTDTLLNGTGPNTCTLGVLSINTVHTCVYDIATGTNNLSGLTININSDGDLRDGAGNTIDACGGVSCNLLGTSGVEAGNEEYGIHISDLGGGEYIAAGLFDVVDQAVPATETPFAISSTTGNGTTVGSAAQRLEVTHSAGIDSATAQGSYSQVVTYTAYTN